MDNKTVFVRTSKGEDEAHSRTMHLPNDAKRTLMMVDGESTYGEISKRAAPSLRAGMEAMLKDLEKDGFIVDKAKARSGSTPKMSIPAKMSVPVKIAKPQIKKPQISKQEEESGGDLDFMSGFTPAPADAPEASSAKEDADAEKSKAEAEALAKQELEAAKLKAQQEAEAVLHKAEQDAARIREEAEREKQQAAAFEAHAREEAERHAREEAQAAKAKEEQARKARLEAEAKELQQRELARKRAEQESAEARRKSEQQAVRPPATPKAEPFAFDTFHVDESKPLDNQSVQKEFPTAVSSGKPGEFAFGEFHVEESQLFTNLNVDLQPGESNAPAETAPSPKKEEVPFDAFKIDISEPAAEPPGKEAQDAGQQAETHEQAAQPAEKTPDQHVKPVSKTEKSPGSTPSHEEIERAEKERKEVEKRLEAEELAAKKHAEEQAKAAAEKEKRLAEAARKEIEKVTQHANLAVDVTQPSARHAQAIRPRRKPFSLGRLIGFFVKLGIFLLVLLIGALFAAPPLLPTRDYIPVVEKILSDKLHQPVHVGYLSLRALPLPQLELSEIYIGKAKQLQADQAQVNFSLEGLFIDEKPIDSIELQGVTVSGEGLQIASSWMLRLAADNVYPVASMTVSKGTLDADAVQFSDIEGTLDFNKSGEFLKASLRSNSGKYSLEISPAAGNKQQVNISVRNSALPLLPSWVFDELTAKGVLSNKGLSVSEFDGRMLGGSLRGNAVVDWRSGWKAKGTMEVKAITMQSLNPLLEGSLDGSGSFRMSAAGLADLAGSAELEGKFASASGIISGVDLIETARTRSREHLPGGRVKFDELGGTFTYSSNQLHLRQVRIASNVLSAVASVDIEKQQVSGDVTATLIMQEAARPVAMRIGGAIDSPTLRYTP